MFSALNCHLVRSLLALAERSRRALAVVALWMLCVGCEIYTADTVQQLRAIVERLEREEAKK